MLRKTECPKVEPMQCPTQITVDDEGRPRYAERQLPYFVRILLNDTDVLPEIDKCIRICLPNITIPSDIDIPPTSTEIPYIEGATAPLKLLQFLIFGTTIFTLLLILKIFNYRLLLG
ncbi:unnamed protein product [Brugia timori]|uniref:ZP domain-containing protein n=1 Tax=Brugia timori TaxID=42155 RepID=A0A0R3RD63_9BILA|nr:unnamed protein product [Brugia timori]